MCEVAYANEISAPSLARRDQPGGNIPAATAPGNELARGSATARGSIIAVEAAGTNGRD